VKPKNIDTDTADAIQKMMDITKTDVRFYRFKGEETGMYGASVRGRAYASYIEGNVRENVFQAAHETCETIAEYKAEGHAALTLIEEDLLPKYKEARRGSGDVNELVCDMFGAYMVAQVTGDTTAYDRVLGEHNQEAIDSFEIAFGYAVEAYDAVRTSAKTEFSRRRYTPRPVDEMTKKEYNRYGWADVNHVLTKKEQARFLEMVGKKQTGDVFPTIYGDKYAITVLDENDIGSVVNITEARFNEASIDYVIRSELLANSEAEQLWRNAYGIFGYEATIEALSDAFGDESIKIFSNNSVQSYEEFRRSLEGKTGRSTVDNNQPEDQRGTNDSADGKFDLRKAPEQGAFSFDKAQHSTRRITDPLADQMY